MLYIVALIHSCTNKDAGEDVLRYHNRQPISTPVALWGWGAPEDMGDTWLPPQTEELSPFLSPELFWVVFHRSQQLWFFFFLFLFLKKTITLAKYQLMFPASDRFLRFPFIFYLFLFSLLYFLVTRPTLSTETMNSSAVLQCQHHISSELLKSTRQFTNLAPN